MTVTVMVEGWNEVESEQVKVYLDERYSMDNDYFLEDADYDPSRHIDEENGRVYMYETVYKEEYPEMNLTAGNLMGILNSLGYGHKDCDMDELNSDEMDVLIKNILKAKNTKNNYYADESDSYQDGNICTIIPGKDYADRKYDQFMEILQFAKKKGTTVHWA